MGIEINWNSKLQAVHTDGRVIDLADHEPHGNPSWPLRAMSQDGAMVFYMDPSRNDVCAGAIGDGWTIRNTPTVSPTPDERAVALVKRIAANEWGTSIYVRAIADEARAIVAALEPVDPELLEARQVVADLYEGQGVAHLREQALSGEGDEWFHTKVALAALRRGRDLASRDVTPCTRAQFEEACRV